MSSILSNRAHAAPRIVGRVGQPDQICHALESVPLRSGKAEGGYNEAWLQDLIQRYPMMLPINDIEPAFLGASGVCMELPVPSGFVDNLLMTRDGSIVVVETKLWRNPQARREVIGQILDYAKDLSRMDYETFQRQVGVALKDPTVRLFDIVCPDDKPEYEARFIDTVSKNLRLGRFLLLIAGDGVQESLDQLTDFLQRHIGLHFTLSLVEMSLWRFPSGDLLVQPRILAKTVQIERAVIRLEGGGMVIPQTAIEPTPAKSSKPTTLSGETFYENLAEKLPTLPDRLKAFVSAIEPLGVVAEARKNLVLKWPAPDGREFWLGQIDTLGRLFTDGVHVAPLSMGRRDLCDPYKQALGDILGIGLERADGPMGLRLSRTPRVADLLDRQDQWISAIADYINAIKVATDAI